MPGRILHLGQWLDQLHELLRGWVVFSFSCDIMISLAAVAAIGNHGCCIRCRCLMIDQATSACLGCRQCAQLVPGVVTTL